MWLYQMHSRQMCELLGFSSMQHSHNRILDKQSLPLLVYLLLDLDTHHHLTNSIPSDQLVTSVKVCT